MKIAIVGAGAAGILAAIEIKKQLPEHEVILIEKNSRIGRKLLATGNGRCNFSNALIEQGQGNYNHSEIDQLLQKDFSLVMDALSQLGISARQIGNLYYPYSLTANSVINILRNQLTASNVQVLLEKEVVSISGKSRYVLRFNNNEQLEVDYLIIATGGKSYPDFGSDGKMLNILAHNGFEVTSTSPGLAPIKVASNDIIGLEGVSYNAEARIYVNNSIIAQEEGEVLFKKDYISGIVIFNLASYLNRHIRGDFSNKDIKISLAFLKDKDLAWFSARNELGLNKLDILGGLFPTRLAEMIYKRCGISNWDKREKLKQEELKKVFDTINNFQIKVTGVDSFKNAQVTIGGVQLEEIDLKTFQTRRRPHLYFIGEVLDVDGLCGGFNLFFAFYSALKCAYSIKESIIDL